MDKRQFASDYILYGLLLPVFMFLGIIVVFVVAAMLEGPLRHVLPYDYLFAHLYVLRPYSSGLADHMQYGMSVGAAFGALMYVACLIYIFIKKRLKNALSWIFAAALETVLILISIIDRHIEHYGYSASNLAGWLQLLVPLLPLVWYICVATKDKRPTKKRPSGV